MIAICPNPYRDQDLFITRQAMSLLTEAGHSCVVCPVFAKPEEVAFPKEWKTGTLPSFEDKLSMVVVIGGDGTILRVVRDLSDKSVPLLGINLGTMGFMSSLEPEELDHVLDAANGIYPISPRMMLDSFLIRDGELIHQDIALNDVVIHGYGECIIPHVFDDETEILNFSGDGIIFSSPTGSTGYSMSAGGPIVEPDARALILSPICAHTMSAKCYVFSPRHSLRMKLEKHHGRRAYLAIDGNQVYDLENGDIVVVRCSDSFVRMINPGFRNFFQQTYDKLK